jgi:hypothetical protein
VTAEIDPAERKRLDMVHNEQTKLRATFNNNLGVGIVITGAISPMIAWLAWTLNSDDSALIALSKVVVVVIAGIAAWVYGFSMHRQGIPALEQLRP